MTNILFIAYYFPPIGGVAVQRSLKFIRYLPQEGYLPLVITGPAGPSDGWWTPYDPTLLDEIPSNIPIHRVNNSLPFPKKGWWHRINRWVGLHRSFSESWIPSATKLSEEVCHKENPRLIFATMSPFESANIAVYLSNKLRIPWVADLRDPWALGELRIYPTFVHRNIELKRMGKLLSSASIIVMNTPEAASSLKINFPDLSDNNIVTITNGYDDDDFKDTILPRKVIIIFHYDIF